MGLFDFMGGPPEATAGGPQPGFNAPMGMTPPNPQNGLAGQFMPPSRLPAQDTASRWGQLGSQLMAGGQQMSANSAYSRTPISNAMAVNNVVPAFVQAGLDYKEQEKKRKVDEIQLNAKLDAMRRQSLLEAKAASVNADDSLSQDEKAEKIKGFLLEYDPAEAVKTFYGDRKLDTWKSALDSLDKAKNALKKNPEDPAAQATFRYSTDRVKRLSEFNKSTFHMVPGPGGTLIPAMVSTTEDEEGNPSAVINPALMPGQTTPIGRPIFNPKSGGGRGGNLTPTQVSKNADIDNARAQLQQLRDQGVPDTLLGVDGIYADIVKKASKTKVGEGAGDAPVPPRRAIGVTPAPAGVSEEDMKGIQAVIDALRNGK